MKGIPVFHQVKSRSPGAVGASGGATWTDGNSPEETLKPNASTIRELENCAQDVHGRVGFGTELLIQFSSRPIPFSDREDDASGWVWGFLELLSNSVAWTGRSSDAIEKRGENETSGLDLSPLLRF